MSPRPSAFERLGWVEGVCGPAAGLGVSDLIYMYIYVPYLHVHLLDMSPRPSASERLGCCGPAAGLGASKLCSGSEAGSYLRLVDFCITGL